MQQLRQRVSLNINLNISKKKFTSYFEIWATTTTPTSELNDLTITR